MAIQLVTSSRGCLSLNPEAVSFLKTLRAGERIGVCAMIGHQNTGKQYFADKVLLDNNHNNHPPYFDEGCYYQGIWIAPKLLKGTSTSSLLLIVEGLDTKARSEDANRLLEAALLLCSNVIYSTNAGLDPEEPSLRQLIQETCKMANSNAGWKKPTLHYLVRDFTTAFELYFDSLEDCLRSQLSAKDDGKTYRMLEELFGSNSEYCFTSPINQFSNHQDRQWSADFIYTALQAKEKILGGLRPFRDGDRTISVGAWINSLEVVIQAINQHSWQHLVDRIWEQIYPAWQRQFIAYTLDCYNIREKVKQRDNETALEDALMRDIRQKVKIQLCFHPITQSNSSYFEEVVSGLAQKVFRLKQQMKIEENNRLITTLYQQIMLEVETEQPQNVVQIKSLLKQAYNFNKQKLAKISEDQRVKLESELMGNCCEALCIKIQIENAVLKSQNMRQGQTISRLERELSCSKQEVVGLDQRIQQMAQQLGTQQNHKSLISDLNKRIQGLKRQLQKAINNQEQQNRKASSEMEAKVLELQHLNRHLVDMQFEMSKSNTELTQQVQDLRQSVASLQKEREERQRLIAETEAKIVEQIQHEEQRIHEFMKNSQKREREKDLMIEKLEKLLRENSNRHYRQNTDELTPKGDSRDKEASQAVIKSLRQEVLRLKEQLNNAANQNQILNKKIQIIQAECENKIVSYIKDINELNREKHMLLSKKDKGEKNSENVNNSSNCVMNLELTQSGFEVKSFVSPKKSINASINSKTQTQYTSNKQLNLTSTKGKDWQMEKMCMEAQIQMQANLIAQNQKLVSALVQKERILLDEIAKLKGIGNNVSYRITKTENYNNSVSPVKNTAASSKAIPHKAKLQKQNQVITAATLHSIPSRELLKTSSSHNIAKQQQQTQMTPLTISVPMYFFNQTVQGKSVLEFVIQVKTCDRKWTIRRKSSEITELYKELITKYPKIAFKTLPLGPSKKTQLSEEQKRKSLEVFLNECIKTSECKSDIDFKRFLCDTTFCHSMRKSHTIHLSPEHEYKVQKRESVRKSNYESKGSNNPGNQYSTIEKSTSSSIYASSKHKNSTKKLGAPLALLRDQC